MAERSNPFERARAGTMRNPDQNAGNQKKLVARLGSWREGGTFRRQTVRCLVHSTEKDLKPTPSNTLTVEQEVVNPIRRQSRTWVGSIHSLVSTEDSIDTSQNYDKKRSRGSFSLDKVEKASEKFIDELMNTKSVVKKMESWNSFMPNDLQQKDNKLCQTSKKPRSWGDFIQSLNSKDERKEFKNSRGRTEKGSVEEGSSKKIDNLSVKMKFIQSRSWSELGQDLLEPVMKSGWPSFPSAI